ncbi:nucleoside hydrolase [Aquicoccus sp. G2-2]|uniref:nucleoside hydrolase n=1 Tax=Aquicoccus sp. G2-2 TaxID=3092120 RepID=UPI002AE032A7|nr:nucleoside hydrolase [Aquicoccus sp. G2-2]MEA1114967.1 nucleoside hydrolase [Aquicoccus sp. G2-2]
MIKNGPEIEQTDRIWIDTDPACGLDRRADPDDCLAFMLLTQEPGIEIAGVSTVFGNADIEKTDRTARALVDKLRREGVRIPGVLRGAAAAGATSTQAQAGLRDALADGPLTILALGPLTNVAAALEGRPDLQSNVVRIVAVMGRRPGHIFHPSEGEGGGMLFGHGPVFRDLNFDKDRGAATELIDMDLPMSLVPYDAARGISLSGADLDRIAQAGSAGSWVASGARGWLAFWQDAIGLDGFHPFDLLAAVYVLRSDLFDCAVASAWVGHDDRLNNFWFFDPVALQVGLPSERPDDALAETELTYCVRIAPAAHAWLLGELAAERAKADINDVRKEGAFP